MMQIFKTLFFSGILFLLIGCRNDFSVADRHFQNQTAFETFAAHQPDSAILLLRKELYPFLCAPTLTHAKKDDAAKIDRSADRSDFIKKVLLLAELSIRNQTQIFPDSLLIQSLSCYDSLLHCLKHENSRQSSYIQLIKAQILYFSGCNAQICNKYFLGSDQYLKALRLLDDDAVAFSSEDTQRLINAIEARFADIALQNGYEQEAYNICKALLNKHIQNNDSTAIACDCLKIGTVLNRPSKIHDSSKTSDYAHYGLCFVESERHPYETALLYEMLGMQEMPYHHLRQEAFSNIRKALSIMPTCQKARFDIHNTLGRAYFYNSQYDSAYCHFMQGFLSDNTETKGEAARCMALLYRIHGNEKAALMMENEYQQSMINKANSVIQISMAQLSHYIDNKHQKIAEKENEWKHAELSLIIGIIIVIIVAAFFVIKKIKRKNRQVAQQMELYEKEKQGWEETLQKHRNESDRLYNELKSNQIKQSDLQINLAEFQKQERILQEQIAIQKREGILLKTQLEKNEQKERKLKELLAAKQKSTSEKERSNQQKAWFQQQWKAFEDSEIYQAVIDSCPDSKEISVASVDLYHHHFSAKNFLTLRKTLNQLFCHCIDHFTEQHSNFNETDINYCLLSFFNITEVQKTALIGLSYQGVRTSRNKILKELHTDDLAATLKQMLEEGFGKE